MVDNCCTNLFYLVLLLLHRIFVIAMDLFELLLIYYSKNNVFMLTECRITYDNI